MNDFIQWLQAPFDEVNEAEDEAEDDGDDEWSDETDDDAQMLDVVEEDLLEQPADEEPAWMQWKRNIRAYAESVKSPLPPSAQ